MNKAIFFVVVPCLIALVLVNVEGQYYGAGYGTGINAAQGNAYNQYYQSYAQALAQRRSLNRLSKSANLARYINFIPLLLLFSILSNRTSLSVIG
ncbi:hypothetical protein FSP39_013039 [Pinctada imbricata]|uniref:Uncharacterized protein n=1 Tax=Pinctada imbricata TaxID=66713 RepID=A0AA88XM65_PINIB|nr:hypothetical protein FSP39_013039 [Pinctada imbricata]